MQRVLFWLAMAAAGAPNAAAALGWPRHRRSLGAQVPQLAIVLFLVIAALFASPAFGAEVTGTVQVAGKSIQWAVVWLEVPTGKPVPPATRGTLDQRNISFSPYVLAVRVGTVVEFPNNDKVFHNVFSFRDGKKFNLGISIPPASRKKLCSIRPG